MRHALLLGLSLWILAGCAPGQGADDRRGVGDDVEDPAEFMVRFERLDRQRFGHQMRALLLAGQYDSLEHVARDLRSSQARWPGGIAKLRSFYAYGFGETDQEESETQWHALIAAARAWVDRTGSVTARAALGNALYGYAWHARGEGYASDVSEDGMRLFHDRLNQAATVLAEAARQPEHCPGVSALLLRVALGLSWDRATYDSIFTAAVHDDPWYELTYLDKATYLLPRWHGREGEWEAYATSASDRIGGPEGDALYARIVYWQAEYYRYVFDKADVSWDRTARGYDYLVSQYPKSIELKSQYALLAVEAEDRARARSMFHQLGTRIDPEVWYKRESFIAARDWALGSD